MLPLITACHGFVESLRRGGPVLDLLSPTTQRSLPEVTPRPLQRIGVSSDRDRRPGFCAQLRQLPLRDDTIGAVIVSAELWLSANVDDTLTEARRVMAPGAVFAVLVEGAEATPPVGVSWWRPTSAEVDGMLRRHFPYVQRLELTTSTTCHIESAAAGRADEVQRLAPHGDPSPPSSSVIHIGTLTRRRLPGAVDLIVPNGSRRDIEPPARWIELAPQDPPGRDPADTQEVEVPLVAQLELEQLRHREQRRQRERAELEERLATTERDFERAHQALEDERQRRKEDREVAEDLEPLLLRERARARRAEAEGERLTAVLERERRAGAEARQQIAQLQELADRSSPQAERAEGERARMAELLERTEAQRRHLELEALDLGQALARANNEAEQARRQLRTAQQRADDHLEEAAEHASAAQEARHDALAARAEAAARQRALSEAKDQLALHRAKLATLARSLQRLGQPGEMAQTLRRRRRLNELTTRLAQRALDQLRRSIKTG